MECKCNLFCGIFLDFDAVALKLFSANQIIEQNFVILRIEFILTNEKFVL
jgi:hypothetical protein